MAKVKIKSIYYYDKDSFEQYETTIVEIDGKEIGKGHYGGEPEDNTRGRDYKWVELLLEKIAKELGADVEIEKIEPKTQEEYNNLV